MHTFFPVAAIVLTLAAGSQAQAGITGKWQGETPAGAPLVLDLKADGDQMKLWMDRQGPSRSIGLKRVKSS